MVTLSNKRPVFRSRDLNLPIRGQCSVNVICLDKLETDFLFVSVEQTRGVLDQMTHPARQGHLTVSTESC